MHPSYELSLEIARHDVDPDFMRSFAVQLAWGYRNLFREIRELDGLTDDYRNELFNSRRGDIATQVFAAAAKQHGVTFDFLRLSCNGQRKPVAKCGRLVLILEAVSYYNEYPQVADYKISLSDMHSYMRQLELDLGDQPKRIRDWSGTALGVLLHGPSGARFSQESKGLGILTLGMPDAAYRQWVSRIDLRKTAMYGDGYKDNSKPTHSATSEAVQADNVIVKTKRNNRNKDVA